jgi:hemerythrin
MSFLEWNPSFAIGVGAVDEQHQELFRRVNDLMTSMAEGKGRDKVESLLAFLESYALTHFSEEQGEMARAGYPGLVGHVKEHESFMGELGALKLELHETGATASLTIAVNNRVCKWLVEHVLRADRAFATFYKRAKAMEALSAPPPLA